MLSSGDEEEVVSRAMDMVGTGKGEYNPWDNNCIKLALRIRYNLHEREVDGKMTNCYLGDPDRWSSLISQLAKDDAARLLT
jgi:hypothetical protein